MATFSKLPATPLIFALLVSIGLLSISTRAAADRPPESASTRGELLYVAHCGSCHGTEMHWRDRRLATDWNGLVAQVRRWQTTLGLIWSEEDIVDVSKHLNSLHYGFPVPIPPLPKAEDSQPEQLPLRAQQH